MYVFPVGLCFELTADPNQDQPFMRTPVVLHSISSFDQDILEIAATPVLEGLSRCMKSAGSLRNEIIVSPDFWSIVQRLHNHTESAPLVFELLQGMSGSTPPAITADNYEAAVSLANDFASAASVGSINERKRDAVVRKQKGVRPEKVA
jgi:brefeldin A-resistance guanine nucleotide exchange factor 1